MTMSIFSTATDSAAAAAPLPHWNTANIYAGLDAADYREAFARLETQLTELEAWSQAHDVRQAEPDSLCPTVLADAALAERVWQLLEKLSAVVLLYRTLDSFIYAFLSTDSYNTLATKETSRLEVLGSRRQLLEARVRGWVGTFAGRIDNLLVCDERLSPYQFFLNESARRSRHLMSEPLEALAADLVIDGAMAFEKLQGNVTSQLQIPFAADGESRLVPITVVRNYSFSADRDLRQRAYHAELAGWHGVRTSVAACLNGIKGTSLTLAKRRGYSSVLQVALDDNHIDQATLDAMLGTLRDALPMFREYLRAKARHLGLPKLAWWDLFAPVGGQTHSLSWREARQTIVENFARFDADLGTGKK